MKHIPKFHARLHLRSQSQKLLRTCYKQWRYIVAAVLVIAGGALLYFGFYGHSVEGAPQQPVVNLPATAPQQSNAPAPIVPASATPSPQQSGSGTPVRITIPGVSIDVPVGNGVYNSKTKQWTLSSDKAYFATVTTKPNVSAGETFIYGHNRSSVFGRLPRIKQGNLAYITTDSRQRFTYRLRTTYTTSPSDTAVLNYSGPPTLVLQTCTGVAFQNRTMFIFDLVGVANV